MLGRDGFRHSLGEKTFQAITIKEKKAKLFKYKVVKILTRQIMKLRKN